jgi:inorganic pyrophosphatase
MFAMPFPKHCYCLCHARYGIALAALGMLATLSCGLTIDGFGPISDNAGGIAETWFNHGFEAQCRYL